MSTFFWSMHYRLSRISPNLPILNYLLMAPVFYSCMGRLPRSTADVSATFNDFAFNRRIRRWPFNTAVIVDKELAKDYILSLTDEAPPPKTIDVIAMDGLDFSAFKARLLKHSGTRTVAKPTHNSGGVIFMDKTQDNGAMRLLYTTAQKDFFYSLRETEYFGLQKKVIIEENIAGDREASDYKFYCSRGTVIFCQVDQNRFSAHSRRLISVPDFRPLDVSLGYTSKDTFERPKSFDTMIRVASRLSSSFDFIRVDLYDSPSGVRAGELALSPGSGMEAFSSERFSIDLLRVIKGAKHSGDLAKSYASAFE